MPCNTPERFSLRLGSKHCTGEQAIAYVLVKCYIFLLVDSIYASTGPLENTKLLWFQYLLWHTLLGSPLGRFLRNWHMCISYIHLYKSTTHKILSKGLLEPVWNWFGQVSLALVGVWLLRRSQATSLMCLRHLLGNCIRWRRIARRSIGLERATVSAVSCSFKGSMRQWDSTQNDFLKWLSYSSQAVSPVKNELLREHMLAPQVESWK